MGRFELKQAPQAPVVQSAITKHWMLIMESAILCDWLKSADQKTRLYSEEHFGIQNVDN